MSRLGRARTVRWMRRIGIGAVISLVLLAVLGVAAVEYSSTPRFCARCHIMEPYYESWKASTHNHVGCIECHYEPGMLEGFEAKFKALTQVAKYVTRTEGTKAWAEVSDQSCLRGGCHSQRLLHGTIPFGRIKFDHRHHLLETRRGKRLRCTTCHSQIVQGSHMTVTTSTCFICHFKPAEEPQRLSDCDLCHGPPSDEIEIEGYRFAHQAYLRRGVDCGECHGEVTWGQGEVPRQRCHSCHAEVGHIERINETEFLHEKHVTEHKVECFDCHAEIQHGRPPPSRARGQPACAPCHEENPHAIQARFFSGTALANAPPMPSRMALAHLTCRSCHPGKAGEASWGADARTACMHCHGVGFASMVDQWQKEVETTLDRLRPLLSQAEAHPRPAEGLRDVRLIERDGSRGAHNFRYARSLLDAAEACLRQAGFDVPPSPGAPRLASRFGCTDSCHLEVGNARFAHAPHLRRAGLDCDACHEVRHEGRFALTHSNPEHGRTTVTPPNCASCHHSQLGRSCGECHPAPQALLEAEPIEGVEPVEGVKSFFECQVCHGDPARGQPRQQIRAACLGCHDEQRVRTLDEWRARAQGGIAQLDDLLTRAQRALGDAQVADDVGARYERAVRIRAFLLRANAAHNMDYAEALLGAAREEAQAVLEALR